MAAFPPSVAKDSLAIQINPKSMPHRTDLPYNTMVEILSLALLVVNAIQLFSAAGVYSKTLNLTKECSFTVWPGLVSGHGTPPLSTATVTLEPGESASISIPAASWSGQLWARTLCSYDSTGVITCLTGDCRKGIRRMRLRTHRAARNRS
ncbi:hypothetical protein RJ639_031060 [Escallonia herrerae]|uniref:Uncharacterized protein n=1 Tax=Escallonia herrerae TaxID=1293975 RepID=A0AA88WZJ1_9ASTE|nr:hypothetical protein RJ639_031060 [Escallonia herrerae]